MFSRHKSTKETVKTIVQEMPDVSGGPVVTNAQCFLHYTRGCGCTERPAFPAPSTIWAKLFCKTRAKCVARMRRRVSLLPPPCGEGRGGGAKAGAVLCGPRPRPLSAGGRGAKRRDRRALRNSHHPAHHILHKYQATTAMAWPLWPDMISRQRRY